MKFHAVATELEASAFRPPPRFRPDPGKLKRIPSVETDGVLEYRKGIEEGTQPLVGYRAPILSEASEVRPTSLRERTLSENERKAASAIRHQLRSEGILMTLAKMLETLGPGWVRHAQNNLTDQLGNLGFPVDLLSFFKLEANESEFLVDYLAARIIKEGLTEELRNDLRTARFAFVKSHRGFQAAAENGIHSIGLVRMQIGGGYRSGLIPGGSFDVVGQLVAAVPQADFLVTVPREYSEITQWLALHCWQLRRPGQLVLAESPLMVTAWAQDNGKAGGLFDETGRMLHRATLTPRFASQNDLHPLFLPGDSFLMDGLAAAGHRVVQSSLLFQGGNVLLVQDPATGERLLLMSEIELSRNMALGLTRRQVLDAFQTEFGVDRCVLLPPVSYHLDLDVSPRAGNGGIVAFVNDAQGAAKLIIRRGISAFVAAGAMNEPEARVTLAHLNAGDTHSLLQGITGAMQPFMNREGAFTSALVQHFAASPSDAPVYNFRCFLGALDLIASRVLADPQHPSTLEQRYFAALRALEASGKTLSNRLETLGWRVIAVPSMPDLHRSVNYLNGIHGGDRYLMPALGGFYENLDDAAAAVFERSMGAEIRLIRIRTAALQEHHGAVHCAAAIYPVGKGS